MDFSRCTLEMERTRSSIYFGTLATHQPFSRAPILMRWHIATISTLLVLLSACHNRRESITPTSGTVPDFADRPAGFACVGKSPTTLSSAVLLNEARQALRQLRLRPGYVHADSVSARITIAGPDAPHGTGTTAQRDAILYLDWRVQPSESSTEQNDILVSAGLSYEPPGLSREERRAVYAQSVALAEHFIVAMPSHPRLVPLCRG